MTNKVSNLLIDVEDEGAKVLGHDLSGCALELDKLFKIGHCCCSIRVKDTFLKLDLLC